MKQMATHRLHWLAALLLAASLLTVLLLTKPAPSSAAPKDQAVTTTLLTDKGMILPVNQTRYLMVQDAGSKLWGVYDTSGNQLIEERFQRLSYLNFGCFSDNTVPEPAPTKRPRRGQATPAPKPILADTLNTLALVSADGKFVSEYQYGVIQVLNANWALGWVLADGTEEDYDYTPDRNLNLYQVNRCDVFYLGENARQVGSLTRAQYKKAEAHEKYLTVQDREDAVTLYDKDFNVLPFALRSTSEGAWGQVDFTLGNRVTHEMILDGCSAVREYNLQRGPIYQVTRTLLDGSQLTGLIDLNGHWLLPMGGELTIKRVDNDYAVVARDDKVGLYSFELERLVIPCEYDSIPTNGQAVDPYQYYGYLCAVRDETRYFISLETGEIVRELPTKLDRKTRLIGGTSYYQLTGLSAEITSLSGKTWRTRDTQILSTRCDGRLLICRAKMSGLYGIYNMNGLTVLDFKYKNLPVVTDDGMVILNTVKNGYQLIRVEW